MGTTGVEENQDSGQSSTRKSVLSDKFYGRLKNGKNGTACKRNYRGNRRRMEVGNGDRKVCFRVSAVYIVIFYFVFGYFTKRRFYEH